MSVSEILKSIEMDDQDITKSDRSDSQIPEGYRPNMDSGHVTPDTMMNTLMVGYTVLICLLAACGLFAAVVAISI